MEKKYILFGVGLLAWVGAFFMIGYRAAPRKPECTCTFKEGETVVGACSKGRATCSIMIGPKARSSYEM